MTFFAAICHYWAIFVISDSITAISLKMQRLGVFEKTGFRDIFHARDWPTECIVNAGVCQARLPWTKALCFEDVLMKRKQFGFSLIELLIVVAIILIIAAIAIPNLISARMSANEASAVQSVRAIQSAETSYATTYPSVGYSTTLIQLSGSSNSACSATSAQACLIDDVLASGQKSGYIFTWTGDGLTPSVTYNINADPNARGSSGRRSFFSNTPGVIRYNTAAAATANDPTI
jgi:prepilin-type N-terminal cleavage/methylation domain-containing protein